MPLYEYKCQKCEDVFEVMQRFSDEPLTVHEICGGAVERLLSAPALQFKGSGWYITDYARKANGSATKDASGDSKPDTKSEAKSESKTEAKDSGAAKPAKAADKK
jgi:putative FmdB family regulatory protein